MSDIPKKYDFLAVEVKLKDFWEEAKVYVFDPDSDAEVYSVDTPPPYMSGHMHAGHAFSYTHQDILVRFQRMLGKNVFYPFGTDDNGLPTEHMVEKKHKVLAAKMPRHEFVALCNQEVDAMRAQFIQDWKDLGISCDWNEVYSTIDPHSVATSQRSFIDLYTKKKIYRHNAPTMWCVRCQTAIAQADLESVDLASTFNDVKFSLADGTSLVISTTRPELLGACVAIFVHPDDKRYTKLIGQKATVPLFGHEVEIFADESADPEKGSGCLMCCSWGDKYDVEAIAKHSLTPRVVFTKEGTLNANAGAYADLKIKDARKQILADLKAQGLLLAQQHITHHVNVHDRCTTAVEFLETKQWFIDVMNHKEMLLDYGAQVKWSPQKMAVRYQNWISGLQWDWCISRQRHYGVPFPVWYEKGSGKVILPAVDELPVDPTKDLPKGYTAEQVEPELDVMDTWATSSCSPQICAHWHDKPELFNRLFPLSLRPQSHDIIRTWAFYTIVKSAYMHETIPWREIVISGYLLGEDGHKMSKSRGNGVPPQEVMHKYGADAFRIMAAGSKLGDDFPYQEKDVVTGKKTVTKLWNAAKFSFMHLSDYDGVQKPDVVHPLDAWLLARLHQTIKVVTDSFLVNEYSKAKKAIDRFFWDVLCDNYLEFAKDRLYNPETRGDDARLSAQYALYHALLSCVKLFAPIMPFITEEVYQLFFTKTQDAKSVHVSSWPVYDASLVDETVVTLGDLFSETVGYVRAQKSLKQLSLKAEIASLSCDAKLFALRDDLVAVVHAQNIQEGELHVSF